MCARVCVVYVCVVCVRAACVCVWCVCARARIIVVRKRRRQSAGGHMDGSENMVHAKDLPLHVLFIEHTLYIHNT